MRWRKRNLWKAGIGIASMLLLLIFMVWVSISVARAHEGATGFATPATVTVQATPTEDATVTALNKEKLVWDMNKDRSDIFWAWTGIGTIVVGVVGAVFTFLQFVRAQQDKRFELMKRLEDAKTEREKRAEERFQAVVEGLSSEREEAKVGAAVMLRTFLRPGYEQFYEQTFDLAVASLRLPRTPAPPEDSTVPLPLTTLSQTLIVVLKEVFPLARSQQPKGRPQSLDATGIQLDNAYLREADLKQMWMPQASLRKANLHKADLSRANLNEAALINADLGRADLSGAALIRADLREADLSRANLNGAALSGANLSRADLHHAALIGSNLSRADLSQTNIEDALALKGTDLRGTIGLTKEQLTTCKTKGVIVDEDSTASSPQSTVAPSSPSQSNDAQTSSAPLAQESLGSSATSSQQDSES